MRNYSTDHFICQAPEGEKFMRPNLRFAPSGEFLMPFFINGKWAGKIDAGSKCAAYCSAAHSMTPQAIFSPAFPDGCVTKSSGRA